MESEQLTQCLCKYECGKTVCDWKTPWVQFTVDQVRDLENSCSGANSPFSEGHRYMVWFAECLMPKIIAMWVFSVESLSPARGTHHQLECPCPQSIRSSSSFTPLHPLLSNVKIWLEGTAASLLPSRPRIPIVGCSGHESSNFTAQKLQ